MDLFRHDPPRAVTGKCLTCGGILYAGELHQCGDITAKFHGGADTSVSAHDTTPESHRDSIRQKLYDVIAASPDGRTADELEVLLGMAHQTVSARLSELLRAGRLVDSGERRKTRLGKDARVLVGRAG